jgi:hypothetical protein
MIKLKVIISILGQITYLIGKSWRKIPMRNETGIHKRQDMW